MQTILTLQMRTFAWPVLNEFRSKFACSLQCAASETHPETFGVEVKNVDAIPKTLPQLRALMEAVRSDHA